MKEDAYEEGYNARLAGKSETANPYDPDDDTDIRHMEWNDGWTAAEDEANAQEDEDE